MWTLSYIEKFISFDITQIPKECNIATITIFLKLKNEKIINLNNFFKNVVLEKGNIEYVEYNSQIKKIDSCNIIKLRKKSKSNFQNSVSIYIFGNSKLIHLNFFKNGTIHATGVKKISNFIEAIYKLDLQINFNADIASITISMININLQLPYEINKTILSRILKAQKISFVINKTHNISISFKTSEKRNILITIHKNSLIISKCTSETDIIQSYNWIFAFLYRNKFDLIGISTKEVLEASHILKENYNGK